MCGNKYRIKEFILNTSEMCLHPKKFYQIEQYVYHKLFWKFGYHKWKPYVDEHGYNKVFSMRLEADNYLKTLR